MEIEFWEDCRVIVYTRHDVNPQDFLEWLGDEEVCESSLKDYLYYTWNPYHDHEEFEDTLDCGFSRTTNIDKFLEEVKNLKNNK